ncbi:MAG TPA: hypothetical protein DCY27_00705 [Desulfobacterales bacterium]|nr:hypothetical protein [Desulfobacterales bacterium]
MYARFRDEAGNQTDIVSDTIYLDMSAPAGGALTATPGPEQVTLNWSGFADSGGSGIGYYMLFYSSTGFPDKTTGAKLYQGGSTSFPHVELTPGKTCYYRVYVVDRAGNVSTGTVTAKATPYSSKKVISPALFLLLNY